MSDVFGTAHAALAFLESHHLQPTTANYAFALEVVSDLDGPLARAVALDTDGGLRLTPRSLNELSQRFLATKSGTAARIEDAVQSHATQLGSLTSDAQLLTKSLSDDVTAMAVEVQDWPYSNALVARLTDAERELADLRRDVAKLQANLGSLSEQRIDPTRDTATQALTSEGARTLFARLGEQNRAYVMMIFSVADLSNINERFGHPVGDNVLSAFVANLRQVLKNEEIIRWTGNEFMVVVTDVALANARLLAEEVLAAFATRRLKLRGSGEWIGKVTGSAGIVVGQGADQAAALIQARAKLYRATIKGLGQVEA